MTDLVKGRWDRTTAPLLLSMSASSTAAVLLVTILGKQVYDITGSELDLGLLGLAEFLPAFVLVLVTGTVADRFDRRRVAAIGIAVEAVAALVLLLYIASEPTAVGPIFALTLVFGLGRAFSSPATRSLPADSVPREQLPWLVTRVAATFQVAMIGGPILGGFLYAVTPTLPYAFAVVLLAAAAAGVLLTRLPPSATARRVVKRDLPASPRERLHEALGGLRFIRSTPVLFGAIALDLFAVLFGGAIALLPAIAEDRLGVGAVGFGWLRAATGIGAAAVTLWLTRRPIHRHVGRSLFLAVGIFGVGTFVLGATTNFAVAFVALLVAAGADSVSVYIRSTLVPLVTPQDKRGRVLAVEMVFIGASNELGAFESGVTGQLLGPAPAVVLGGMATIVVAVSFWFGFPALRKVDRFPQPDHATPVGPERIAAEPRAPDRPDREPDEPVEPTGARGT